MKALALFLIRLYQLCLAPFLGPCCRFFPSCSEYSAEAISRYGFWKGLRLTITRTIKCGPWHPGGYDPVAPAPDRKLSVHKKIQIKKK